jgi:hypothetical protein
MAKKFIIISGCSFSDSGCGGEPFTSATCCSDPIITDCKVKRVPWPTMLHNMYPEIQIENYAACGHGNDWVSMSIIAGCQRLLKWDVRPEEIFVLAQWTGMQRRALLVNEETTNMHFQFKDLKDEAKIGITNALPIGLWVDYDTEFAKVLPAEQSLLMSLEHILRLQWYLQRNNINFKFFSFNDIFTDIPKDKCGFRDDEIYRGEEKDFTKTIADIYPSLSYLFEIIDWDTWWMHGKYGGMQEWIMDNVELGLDGGGGGTWKGIPAQQFGHPLTKSHKQFTNEVIVPILGEFLNE